VQLDAALGRFRTGDVFPNRTILLHLEGERLLSIGDREVAARYHAAAVAADRSRPWASILAKRRLGRIRPGARHIPVTGIRRTT
jgi:hypothetical protein